MIDLIGRMNDVRHRANQIFDLITSILRLNETGGSYTPAALNTEYDMVIIDVPLGSFKPLKVKVDMTNMAWGDTTTIKWYERISSMGNYIEKDEEKFDGPQNIVPLSPMKNIHLEPNRFGFKITIEQTAGTLRAYPWELLYDA